MDTQSGLTPWLREKIQNGEAILFLGAGAARGAQSPTGEQPPTGDELRDLIATKFLGGRHKDKTLARVAEYAKNESSLAEVQGYVKSLFFPLQPAPFHELIPKFRWFAIATTNYDLIIERAYERATARLQDLSPIIRDGDNFSDVLRDNRALPYLKLHGCVTAISDENLPLVLASEEYAKHRKNRQRLFMHFADWARERPVVFAGYDIADPNIQQILFDLADLGINRPTYAVVDPALDEIAMRYWQARRFVPVPATFESFLKDLDGALPPFKRTLAALRSQGPSNIQRWISSRVTPSDRLLDYLDTELDHVHPGIKAAVLDAKAFYQGLSVGWGAIEQNLDVKRRISDEIIVEAVLTEDPHRRSRAFLVKGHAGSGKSVLLHRVAWESAKDFDALVFYLREGGVLRPDIVAEIAQLTKTPLLLVLDDAIPHLADIQQLMRLADQDRLPITLLLGARTNEWNVAGQELDPLIKEDYELRDLSEREIQDLLDKLTAHRCLGELAALPRAQQTEHFKLHAERQLLVALHEATTGKSFEEIVADEYENVVPAQARILYLDICTLHRLGVAVRAGLVSRVSGITFDFFNAHLFRPLEHVVRTYFDTASRDYVYRTRHPLIAEFVFKQALPDAVERAAQIIRIIRHMDVDYESDRDAFTQLVRGKTLADLFADKAIVSQIFNAAAESGASKSFISHQKAVFELHHPNGNMRLAMQAVREAEQAAESRDRAIIHTKATVLRRMALESTHPLETEKLRNEARQILRKLQTNARVPHPFNTYGQLLLDELKDRLSPPGEDVDRALSALEQRAVAETIRQAEECIFVGLQHFPNDDYLLTLDSRLADLLQDHPRALASLKLAFEANPARGFIAVRLARTCVEINQMQEAKRVLNACLAENPSSKECHLEMAKVYMREGEAHHKQAIAHHLQRSFTEGDTNFDAQFWFARHQFLHGDRALAEANFRRLSEVRTSPQHKRGTRGLVLAEDNEPVWYQGYVKNRHESFCFVSCPDLRYELFVRAQQFPEEQWQAVKSGTRVRVNLAFSLRGPQGVNAILT